MEFKNLTKKEKEIIIETVIEKLKQIALEGKPFKFNGIGEEVYIIDVKKHPEVEGRLIIRACDLKKETHYDVIVDIVDDKETLQVVDYFTVEA